MDAIRRVSIGNHEVEVAHLPAREPMRPTVVLLHEALGCVRRWKEWPVQLAEATGCGVVAYSRPGHGRSSRTSGTRPHDYLQREALVLLPELLAVMQVGPRVLVGHSDGASIATIYAGTVPDAQLRGVVQLAPHFMVEEEALVGIRAIRESWATTNLRRRLRKYHGTSTDDLFRQWTETWLDPAFASWDITDCLPRVTVPMLLLQGDADEYGTSAHFDLARRRCRSPLETVMLPEVGHSPHLEAAADTTAAVAAFIRGLPHAVAS